MNATIFNIAKKVLLALAILSVILGGAVSSCSRGMLGCSSSSSTTSTSTSTPAEPVSTTFGDIAWPTSELVQQIPEPESKYGKISSESSSYFSVYIATNDKSQYTNYVAACQEKGFTVDYSKYDSSFNAENEAGYSLSLHYDEEENYMTIRINAPKEESSSSAASSAASDMTPAAAEPAPESAPAAASDAPINGIRPSFKAAVDSYEAFINEYCDFMKKYAESGNPVSMLADYTKFMAQYADTMSKLDAMESEDMSPQESTYLLNATTRMNQRLAETAAAV